MLNTRDTVVAEQRRCLYVAAAGLIQVEEQERSGKSNKKGWRKKKRQLQVPEGKQEQCGLGNGWLEDSAVGTLGVWT